MSGFFGAVRRIVLAIGAELPESTIDTLVREGLAVSRVDTVEQARWFVGDRMPAAVLVGACGSDKGLAFVRWLRESERMAFVSIFVAPAGPSIAEALRAGADDVFAALDEEAGRCMAARVERAQAMSQLALVDALTLLHNRRFMNDRLEQELSRAARAGKAFSIAVLDLDDFKRVNHAHGHAAGDRVLVAFARALRNDLRAYDVPCRIGGDEFVILFPDCDRAGAHAALDKLRSRATWALPGLPPVSFSAGVAAFPEDGDAWSALFTAADDRMLHAKSIAAPATG
ncbi:MAG TPA: GGDEF domain-containing protein [Polyangiaceae bacterium]|jgi:diguanylate cyclase (GGDEF)-like protein|nr:GGDEF domain-containing protein [Polyangiaceae bacterium]